VGVRPPRKSWGLGLCGPPGSATPGYCAFDHTFHNVFSCITVLSCVQLSWLVPKHHWAWGSLGYSRLLQWVAMQERWNHQSELMLRIAQLSPFLSFPLLTLLIASHTIQKISFERNQQVESAPNTVWWMRLVTYTKQYYDVLVVQKVVNYLLSRWGFLCMTFAVENPTFITTFSDWVRYLVPWHQNMEPLKFT